MKKCSKCNKNITFIKLKSGKWNPVDPFKHTIIQGTGSTILVTDDGDVIRGTLASVADGANASGYISHFATCIH